MSKVEEQFNVVKELPNLFPKTTPTELPPLRNMNHCIDPKPGSELLPTVRPSALKFDQQINDKLNAEIKLVHIYFAPNNTNAIVMLGIAKRD